MHFSTLLMTIILCLKPTKVSLWPMLMNFITRLLRKSWRLLQPWAQALTQVQGIEDNSYRFDVAFFMSHFEPWIRSSSRPTSQPTGQPTSQPTKKTILGVSVPQGKPNDTPGRTAGAIIFTFVGLGILYYIYREYQKKNSDGQNKLPYADDGKTDEGHDDVM